jgi:hypothetical protein
MLKPAGTIGEEGRQMHGAAVVGDHFYVIGGNRMLGGDKASDDYPASVVVAPIDADGGLGAFAETTPLPQPRCYIGNTTVVRGQTIYVVQGLDGTSNTKLQTIAWATQQTGDGALSAWQESAPSPAEAVTCAAAVVSGSRIHLLGGSNSGGAPTTTVETAALAEDGAVSAWEDSTELPFPLWFHSAGIVGDTLFVWGGLRDAAPGSTNPIILRNRLAEDGSLTSWTQDAADLTVLHYSAACTVVGDFVLSFNPRPRGGGTTGDVIFGKVMPDGSLRWAQIPAELPVTMYTTVAADTARGVAYLPGGRVARDNFVLNPQVYSMGIKVAPSTGAGRRAIPAVPERTLEVAVNPLAGPGGKIAEVYYPAAEPAASTEEMAPPPSDP